MQKIFLIIIFFLKNISMESIQNNTFSQEEALEKKFLSPYYCVNGKQYEKILLNRIVLKYVDKNEDLDWGNKLQILLRIKMNRINKPLKPLKEFVQDNNCYQNYFHNEKNTNQVLNLYEIINSIEKIINLFNIKSFAKIVDLNNYNNNSFKISFNFLYIYEDLIKIFSYQNASFFHKIVEKKDISLEKEHIQPYLDVIKKDIEILKTIEKESINTYNNLFNEFKHIIINYIQKFSKLSLFNEPMQLRDMFNRFDYNEIDFSDLFDKNKYKTIKVKKIDHTIAFLFWLEDEDFEPDYLEDISFLKLVISITYYKDSSNNDKFNIFLHRDNLAGLFSSNNYCVPSAYNIIESKDRDQIRENIDSLIENQQHINEIIKFIHLNFKNIQFPTATDSFIDKQSLKIFEEGISFIPDENKAYFLNIDSTHDHWFKSDMEKIKDYYEKIIKKEDVFDISSDLVKRLLNNLSKIRTNYKLFSAKTYQFTGLNRGYSYIFSPFFGSDLPIITEYSLKDYAKDKIPESIGQFHEENNKQLLSNFFENHGNDFDGAQQAKQFIFCVRANSPFSPTDIDHVYRVIAIE
jgi:hypothetical protein